MDWPEPEAQAHLEELLQATRSQGPQFITRDGEPVAVAMTVEMYERLRGDAPTFKELLREPPYVEDFDRYLERSKDLPREVDLGFDE